ncbi:MAG: hypothetical protein AB1515_07390, partial [Nitrospirota bacterium]
GAAVGLLADRFGAGPVGPQLVAKFCIGVVGGLLTHRLLLTTPWIHAGVSWLLWIAQGVWMTAWLRWRSEGGWNELYLTALPEACYTAIIVMLGLWLLRPWRRAGERTDRVMLPIDR